MAAPPRRGLLAELVGGMGLVGCQEASIRQRHVRLVVIQDEQPDRRREIAVLAFVMDAGDQI